MPEVRAAPPEMFEEIYPLLQEFPQQNISKDLWKRMLFDPPWPVEEPHRGYVLVDEGKVVGFYGTMFSRRVVRGRPVRFCNLSTWIVKESHRAHSLQILRPILALEDYVLVNPSPNAAVLPIFKRFGFEVLEDAQWLVAPVPSPRQILRTIGTSLITEPTRIRRHLDAGGREIQDHLRGTVAAEALVLRGNGVCHVVATASPWKRGWRLAHVRYASDWKMVSDHAPLLAVAFLRRLGTVGLRVDARHVPRTAQLIAIRRPITLPPLYRPGRSGITPDLVDGLYAEGLFQPW